MLIPHFTPDYLPSHEILSYHYDRGLLAFSVVLAFIATYNILLIVEHLQKERYKNKFVWLFSGTLTYGIGIFAMHLIAMRALSLPIAVNYDLQLSLLAVFCALLAAIVLLFALGKNHHTRLSFITYGVIFSITILLMHYLGMAAVQIDANMYFNLYPFILSLFLILFMSLASLFIAHRTVQFLLQKENLLLRSMVALIMAGMMSISHYLFMNEMIFVATGAGTIRDDFGNLSMLIAVLILESMAILFSISVFMGRKNRSLSTYPLLNRVKVQAKIYRQTLLVFLPMLALVIIISVMALFVQDSIKRSDGAKKSMAQTDMIANQILDDFDNLLEELFFRADDPLVKEFLEGSNIESKMKLVSELSALAKVKKIFDQIRVFSIDGIETLRIDYSNGQPMAIPEHKLQDKSHRYYFQELAALGQGGVYISQFDLNVENDEVETPIKPVIRFATVIYNDKGEKLGYIMFNYFGHLLLNKIREKAATSSGKLFFLNAQGYYLIGPSLDKEWGFMFNQSHTFKEEFPLAWDTIAANNSGHFEVNSSLFSFITVGAVSGKNAALPAKGETERWKVILYLPTPAWILSSVFEHLVSIIFIAVLLIITLFIAWSTALNSVYRKLAEQDQKKSLNELNFQKYALDEHAIVSITDGKGNICYVNDKFVQISGYDKSELLGKNHNLLKSGQHSADLYKQMWQTIRQGKTWHGEFKNRAKNGSFYWVKSTIVPELDEKGNPQRYISIRTDITRQKNSESRLSNAQTIANVGDWKHNLLTNKITWSDQNYRIFGYEPGQLELKFWNILQLVHPQDQQIFLETHSSFTPDQDQFSLECRIIRPDGEVRYINSIANVLRDEQGLAITLTGVIHDITSHKLAEREISKLYQAVESSASIVMVTDNNGIIEYINPAFSLVTGYSPSEVIGHKTSVLRSDSTSKETYQELWDTIQSGRTWHGEFKNRCKDGSYYWAATTISPVIENGQVTHFTGIQQDITERKLMEEQLKQQQRELRENLNTLTESRNQLKEQAKIQVQLTEKAEKADRAKSEFLSAMSHELRTPLNSILGFAQIIEYKSEQPLTEIQKASINHILKGGRHLLELINEILDLTKIESGKMQINIENIRLFKVIEESLELLESIASEKQIKILWDTPQSADVLVKSDFMRLKQVILNLLSNAIKYNRQEGQVTISTEQKSNGRLRLFINDTGLGIPKDKQDTIFQPFTRLETTTAEVEGTGIGLALSKKIIELLDGQIGCSSILGEGSLFWLDIPMAEIDTNSSSLSITQHKLPHQAQQQEEIVGKLLYIEDNPASIKLMEQLVYQITGLKFISAHNAELGLNLAKTQLPDMIILDINLPGMNGNEAVTQLKKMSETQHIPVIALSANAMPNDIRRGLEAGFQQYLTKPLDINNMLEIIKETLRVNRSDNFS